MSRLSSPGAGRAGDERGVEQAQGAAGREVGVPSEEVSNVSVPPVVTPRAWPPVTTTAFGYRIVVACPGRISIRSIDPNE